MLLGELDRETQAFGLAVPSGIVTHTGVAGLTLGGGIGWIMRKHGLSIDQLVSVDLVTADGEFVQASADRNPDLFWGVRGGGGNFGIVTEFEFRCVPLGTQVVAGPVFWPMNESANVLRFYRDWVAEAPDELMTIVVHRKAPPLPFVPAELHGQPVVVVACCWAGDIEEGERFLRPLKEFGSPVLDACVPKPFLAHQAMFDPSFPPGRWYYFKACDVAELNDEIIDITVEHSSQISSPLTAFPIWQMGGALSRVADEETAFNGRSAGFTYNIGACTETSEGFDEEREWVRGFWSALRPWHQGVYVNFLGDEGADRVRQSYGACQVRPAPSPEAEVRPGQLLPAQPERTAELGEGGRPPLNPPRELSRAASPMEPPAQVTRRSVRRQRRAPAPRVRGRPGPAPLRRWGGSRQVARAPSCRSGRQPRNPGREPPLAPAARVRRSACPDETTPERRRPGRCRPANR